MKAEEKHIQISRVIKMGTLAGKSWTMIHEVADENATLSSRNSMTLITIEERETLMKAARILEALSNNASPYGSAIEHINYHNK